MIISAFFSQQVILVSPEDRYEAQHQAVLIIHTLIEFDDQYLATQVDIVNALKSIWSTDLYKVILLSVLLVFFRNSLQIRFCLMLQSCEANVSCDLWHLVAKALLHYFSHHTNDIDLLFLLLKALCMRFIPDFLVSKHFFFHAILVVTFDPHSTDFSLYYFHSIDLLYHNLF